MTSEKKQLLAKYAKTAHNTLGLVLSYNMFQCDNDNCNVSINTLLVNEMEVFVCQVDDCWTAAVLCVDCTNYKHRLSSSEEYGDVSLIAQATFRCVKTCHFCNQDICKEHQSNHEWLHLVDSTWTGSKWNAPFS
jgi:hypothetical protein